MQYRTNYTLEIPGSSRQPWFPHLLHLSNNMFTHLPLVPDLLSKQGGKVLHHNLGFFKLTPGGYYSNFFSGDSRDFTELQEIIHQKDGEAGKMLRGSVCCFQTKRTLSLQGGKWWHLALKAFTELQSPESTLLS